MSSITVGLTSSSTMSHVPLAALGYALRRAEVLAPLHTMALSIKTIDHCPTDKLLAGLVLILAGGRALYQSNWLLRPNQRLACAWGFSAFAEQSTISDTFDALQADDLQQLQTAFATITRQWSFTCRHDFRRSGLTLDGDLTGLPASRRAEGSTKGYFAGKKTVTGGKLRALRRSPMAKRWVPCSFPVRKKAIPVCSRWSQ